MVSQLPTPVIADVPKDCNAVSDIRWQDVEREFEFDGAWRDIYVHDTDRNVWQLVLDEVAATYPTVCLQGGEPIQPPSVNDLFAPDRISTLLTICVRGVEVNCHFFTPHEIEFDLDPREVKGQEQVNALIAFMRRLADVTRKSAVLTCENCPANPIFRVEPDDRHVQYFPA